MSGRGGRAAEEAAADEPVRRRRWHERIWKPSLAQSGFILSVTLALINAFYAIRGSVIVVQPPEQIILYRDGQGDQAVLTFAMRLAMINAADSAHGDVLMKASLAPGGGPAFAFTGTVEPVFTDTADAGAKCPLESRCIALPGFTAIEPAEQIIDIGGGNVRGVYLSYPVAGWNCSGDEARCARFGDFGRAVAALAGRPLDVTVRLKFYGDGSRTLTCRTKPIDARYLARYGWMTLSCREAEVHGGPLF